MRAADRAWVGLAAAVVAYEVGAPRGELLSQGVDRYLTRRPWLTRGVVCYLAAHLLNVIPDRVDPLARLADVVRR
ncbi:hypothetical protein I5G72_gp64 [Mycobacterium phage Collard]|uniref:Uncharacterized protein n=1 Tax=Mycobacterium phage Collard TaxID=2301704 RepID=A0A385DV01_9CAUD|nr:hypothetical protein I5G72_gp64 [Mycobacterium phage Collard]AXQ63211.1 hypothetical protein SEA_COLLARD_35 [Mycobacterium phage Collard]UEM46429.1 hypothetical protein SEA_INVICTUSMANEO_35 [Mycobacterium phage InvictusManeo]